MAPILSSSNARKGPLACEGITIDVVVGYPLHTHRLSGSSSPATLTYKKWLDVSGLTSEGLAD